MTAPKPARVQPFTIITSSERTCGHCTTVIMVGAHITRHCRLCDWWTCPVCTARNSRTGHTHDHDHVRNYCPGKGQR
jgi:hypothetical protein